MTWYHDPEVLRFSEGVGTPPYDAGMVERMFREMATRCEACVIEVDQGGTWRAVGDAAFRSRGLGRRVLALLVARARALGWPRLVVSGISTDNVRARRLYEGAGFQITGTTGDPERPMWTMELPFS